MLIIEEEITCPKSRRSSLKGIERECMRVDMDAKISNRPHFKSLGHKLTHPFITTDYAESLLELITPPFEATKDLIKFCEQLHLYVSLELEKNQERIWPNSMPPILPENHNEIMLADFGQSFSGQMKTLYRKGLGLRYGRKMQSIAGVHFNFSYSEKSLDYIIDQLRQNSHHYHHFNDREMKNALYMKALRNFKRRVHLLHFMFSNTDQVHQSFFTPHLPTEDQRINVHGHTLSLIHANSYRMGEFGYTSKVQKDLYVCLNSLSSYIKTLERARLSSYKAYEEIGVYDSSQVRQQISTNILQIDNEYYSTIRPKAVADAGQSSLGALHTKGIQYLEVRMIDVNPLSPIGISEKQMNILEEFLWDCLLDESLQMSKEECFECDQMFLQTGEKAKNLQFDQLKYADKLSHVFEKYHWKESLLSQIKSTRKSNDFIQDNFDKMQSHYHALREVQSSIDFSEIKDLVKVSFETEQLLVKDQKQEFKSLDDYIDHYFDSIAIKDL